MGVQVLLGCDSTGKPYQHTSLNDVESIMYGLMEICIHQAGPLNQKRDFKLDPHPKIISGVNFLPTEMWTIPNVMYTEIGFIKTITWTHLEEFVIPSFHPYFKDLGGMFIEIAGTLFPKDDMPRHDYNLLINSPANHLTIINIIKKYRDRMPDEEVH